MNNALVDLSVLTDVPEKYYNKIIDQLTSIIADAVDDSRIGGNSTTDIDIGIGTLIIGTDDNSVKYKFIPSKKLESEIVLAFKNKRELINHKLDDAIVKKVQTLYKDLI